MDFDISSRASGLRVGLRGRLTFIENEAFRRLLVLLATVPSGGTTIEFDLSGVSFIDSAGLGLLLHARDSWRGRSGQVILQGASGQVARMLVLARFSELFDQAA